MDYDRAHEAEQITIVRTQCPRGKGRMCCVFKAQGPEVSQVNAAAGVCISGVNTSLAVCSWLHTESPSEQDGVKSVPYRKTSILVWEINWH